MLEHIPTRLLALAALLGAFLHVLVGWELLAFLAAPRARLRAGGTDEVRKRTAAGRDVSGGTTMLRTIQASPERGSMLFFALREHTLAVGRAGITGALAIAARLGALIEGVGMSIASTGLVARGRAGGEG
jgi:hypothetical protein